MLNQKLSSFAANVCVDALMEQLNGGKLCLYMRDQPDGADVPVPDAWRVSTLHFGEIAFAPAEDGVAEANPIESDDYAERSGKARWYRTFTASGVAVFDGSIGSENANLLFDGPTADKDGLEIQIGSRVSVSKMTYGQPTGA